MKEVIPSMFDTEVNFANISIAVDKIDRGRTDTSDNVMAICYEEQPFMWEFVKGDLQRAIQQVDGEIDFLDVGTGSGAWSILVAKNLNAKRIVAIDKSPRAIEKAKENAKKNGVSLIFQEEFYNKNSASYRSAKSIGIYAPYHLYPSEMEMKIPQHARGGVDGQQVFREQLRTANHHLAVNGSIVFNQMCLGRNGNPEFARYIPELLDDVSLKYTNIFPPMKSKEFLAKIYGDAAPGYQQQVSSAFPELYYCDGVITRDSKGEIEVVEHDIDLMGRSWSDRIELHKQIARHGFSES